MENLFNSDELFNEAQAAKRERRPWLGKGVIKNISAFYSFKEFETLINQTGIWTPERLQVFLDNKPLSHNDLFLSEQQTSGVKPTLNLKFLTEAIDRGSSVVLNDIAGLSAGLMQIRNFLSGWTGGKLDCNLYYSQKDHQAFPIHYDVHDVFAIQVHGNKHWQVFDKGQDYPINHPRFTTAKLKNPTGLKAGPILDFIFEPGDIVYIPSGYYHHATCRQGQSIHLSFGLVEMIGVDVISMAFEQSIEEVFFRTPLKMVMREKDPIDFYLQKWAKQVKDLSRKPEFKKRVEAHLDNFSYRGDRLDLGSGEEE
tara:strand:+ start:389 stop:1321 length:933 start_codon:yes stop_codon:yes gene_type:complete